MKTKYLDLEIDRLESQRDDLTSIGEEKLIEFKEIKQALNIARVVLPKGTFYCYDKNNKDTIKRCESQCDECIKIEGT